MVLVTGGIVRGEYEEVILKRNKQHTNTLISNNYQLKSTPRRRQRRNRNGFAVCSLHIENLGFATIGRLLYLAIHLHRFSRQIFKMFQ